MFDKVCVASQYQQQVFEIKLKHDWVCLTAKSWYQRFYSINDLIQDIWILALGIQEESLRDWTWLLHNKFRNYIYYNIVCNNKIWKLIPIGSNIEDVEGSIIPDIVADSYLARRFKLLKNISPLELMLNENYYSGLGIRELVSKLGLSVGSIHNKYVKLDIGGNYVKKWRNQYV